MKKLEEIEIELNSLHNRARELLRQWELEANQPYISWAQQLRADNIKECNLFISREELLSALPENSIGAEVGVAQGEFSLRIMEIVHPRMLHLIDSEQISNMRIRPYIDSQNIKIHRGDSGTVLSKFENNYFDWVYIDADHTLEGVKRDIVAAKDKLVDGGLLIFNDYTCWSPLEYLRYGVMQAVNEFIIDEGWRVVHFALHPLGYHDIAIRKPDKASVAGNLGVPKSGS